MLQTLESVIAILMILVIFVIFYAPNEPSPEFETIIWKQNGFNALKILDDNNELREYALSNDTLSIEEKLQSLLPNLIFKVVICDESCSKPDIEVEKLVSVSYFISGATNSFNPKKIVLYMW